MAGSAQSLGTLVVQLAANTAQLTQDLGQAARLSEQQLSKIQDAAKKAGEGIGLALAAGFAYTVAAVKETLEQFDAFSKDAQKVGIATEEFSKLSYAAKLADVSTDDLTSTLAKLAKNQVAAASGNKEMADNFATLGINLKNADGSLRSTGDVFGDLADLFKALPDGAGKTAIAIALLGKSGAQAIPLLNGGRDSLKELGDQAEAFGITVDTKTGKAAEDFNDNLTKLHAAAEGFGAELTKNLLPSLVQYSNDLVDGAQKGNSFKDAADGIATALRGVAVVAAVVVAAVKDIGTTLAAATDTVSRFYAIAEKNGNTNPFKNIGIFGAVNATKNIKDFFKGGDASAVASNASQGYSNANDDLANAFTASLNPSKLPDAAAASAGDKSATAAAKKAQDDFIAASAKREAATKSLAAAEQARKKALAEQEALERRVLKDTEDMNTSLEKAADNLYHSTIPGVDEYNDALTNINKQGAKFLRDGVDSDVVDKYVGKMQALAKATLDAATATNKLAEDNKTLDLEAQASDAEAASKGMAQLAGINRDYARQAAELEQDFDNNRADDAVEQYDRQRQALDKLHDQQVKDMKNAYDDTAKFVSDGANIFQNAIQDALTGKGFKDGIRGFLGGIADALQQAAAQIAAANLAKKFFGNAGSNGGDTSGGWLDSLFSGSKGSSGSGGSGQSIFGSLFGGGDYDFGGFFAAGGNVSMNKPIVVGENGPELWMPPSNGTIIPNGGMRGRSGSRTSVVNVNMAPTTTRRTAVQIADETSRRQRVANNRNG